VWGGQGPCKDCGATDEDDDDDIRHSSVSEVARYKLDSCGSIIARNVASFVFVWRKWLWSSSSLVTSLYLIFFPTNKAGWSMKLTTYLRVVPKLRLHCASSPFRPFVFMVRRFCLRKHSVSCNRVSLLLSLINSRFIVTYFPHNICVVNTTVRSFVLGMSSAICHLLVLWNLKLSVYYLSFPTLETQFHLVRLATYMTLFTQSLIYGRLCCSIPQRHSMEVYLLGGVPLKPGNILWKLYQIGKYLFRDTIWSISA
jgi:hypothetical protein